MLPMITQIPNSSGVSWRVTMIVNAKLARMPPIATANPSRPEYVTRMLSNLF